MISKELQDQIEELMMMQRVDTELSATLNFESVMMLTLDWALRRTGASAGMLNMITPDGTALTPLAMLGYPPEYMEFDVTSPLPLSYGIVGRAARTRAIQIVKRVQDDPDYIPLLSTTLAQVAVPMEMRGRLLGVLNLESDEPAAFDNLDVPFVRRLASRAAVALDNARLYRETEQRADEMAALYSVSRTISASLERQDVLTNSAQSLAAVLGMSGTIMTDYRADPEQLMVTAVYRLGTARHTLDILPPVGDVLNLDVLPEISAAVREQRVLAARVTDPSISISLKGFLAERRIQSMLLLPLTVQDQIHGVALVVEGRRDRRLTDDEILMCEALASQIGSALRQAKLYEDVRELEKLKSEMIRMASHDLRNPLNNAIGFLELLMMSIGNTLSEDEREFVANIRRSTSAMKSLIDDLLTLERVESERKTAWKEINISHLVRDVTEAQQATATLKHQALTVSVEDIDLWVRANPTQIRQAMTNLISNAIKYTPEDGRIQARLARQGKRIIFEVQDNGYGISPEKQARLFQRFYRAHESGTEHIQGTGLGLSLVKTVIERHGGEVWVHSTLGQGSTFGFWLPLVPAPEMLADAR